MFYSKNVPGWERALRVMMGIAVVALSIWQLGSNTTGWVVGGMGATAMMTGLIGFCPACAMVGRKLHS